MSNEFTGSALPLDADSVSKILGKMSINANELWAVLTVETRGCGFLPDRRPAILFERHIFHKLTNGKHDSVDPNISNATAGGYGAGGANQYLRLEQAMALDKEAALRSTSWGLGQIMGFNFESAGYVSVDAMVKAMSESEGNQLDAMVGPMIKNGWVTALRAHDWSTFARGYNGPAFAKNKYDTRLSGAFQKYAFGGLPDLDLRAAQVYLTYLGLEPGPVDGVMGRFTRSSLNAFQIQHGLPISDVVDDELLRALNATVANQLQ
ncbi:N-acetylmuramidase domain-containing protein (plasmid) [Cupriavidus pinatubonensis]|uniref:N-acetylmuramidase domain-containing protein n=1 Tax=Cupriavidus pinatubonensis TaxID=248026 RepID=UPI001C735AA8|nr:N-acetylmuramidase domain-containing protein [Cupriavidus pinatubonensis]QYY33786.1 N-acetylmuramidase domain-containing protein [Cupriavidus pinatubonensis]